MSQDQYKKRLAEVEDESANIIMRLQAELTKEREANRQPASLRPEVLWFAVEMELALRANDHKTGWSEEHQSWLLGELYRNAGKIREDRGNVRAVNTANFAMMIADNKRLEGNEPNEGTNNS